MTIYESYGCKPYTAKKCYYDIPSSALFHAYPSGFTYYRPLYVTSIYPMQNSYKEKKKEVFIATHTETIADRKYCNSAHPDVLL